jgi:hypothetical protein
MLSQRPLFDARLELLGDPVAHRRVSTYSNFHF